MRVFWLVLALLVPTLLWPTLLAAQQDDKGYLTRLLQDSLSSAGRQVQIEGFQGALSSRASLTSLTIADDQGIWLTLHGVTLDWSRAALLRGRLEVTALTADAILLDRLPQRDTAAIPATQAQGFSLPDLPVSVSIGKIRATRVDLGATVLGRAVALSLDGALQLGNGEGAATLAVRRIDGALGALTFAGTYASASRQLALDLSLNEGASGIAAMVLGISGQPPVALTLRGSGDIDDFQAQVTLQTDGADRLAGTVRRTTGAVGTTDTSRFSADLAGDIAPLFAPAYRDFFGTNIHLAADAARLADGGFDLRRFTLEAAAVSLGGRLRLAASGLPDLADITGRIAPPDGVPVVLPLPGAVTEVTGATVALQFDAVQGPDWQGSIGLSGLHRPGFDTGLMVLSGKGRLSHADAGVTPALTARFSFLATGIGFADPGLAAAVGSSLTGEAELNWQRGQALAVPHISLAGDGYGVTASGTIATPGVDLQVAGSATAQIADLSRLSLLARRELAGAVSADLSGSAQIVSGAFDLTADLAGQDIALDQPQFDSLLQGQSQITLSAARSEAGTILRQLDVSAGGARITASGNASPTADRLAAQLVFADLSALGPPFGGALTADLALSGAGPLSPQTVSLNGTATDLTTGIAPLDRLIAGASTVALDGTSDGLALSISALSISAAKAGVTASGVVSPEVSRLAAQIALPDLSALVPRFGGALEAAADVTLQGPDWQLLLQGTGQDLSIGMPMADRLLTGQSTLSLAARPQGSGVAITGASLATPPLALTGAGHYEPGITTFAADVQRLDLAALQTMVGGILSGRVSLAEGPKGLAVDAAASGRSLTMGLPLIDPLLAGGNALTLRGMVDAQGGLEIDAATLSGDEVAASVKGRVKPGESHLVAEVALASLAPLGPGWHGSASAAGSYREQDGERLFDLSGSGNGVGNGLAPVDRLLAGETRFAFAGSESAGVLALDRATLSNPRLSAEATGTLASGDRKLALTARIADVAVLAPGFSGALSLEGALGDQGGPFQLDLTAAAGAALSARISGTVARDVGSVALALAGQAEAGLVNGFITPRSVQGRVGFDLALKGAPRLSSLTGTLRAEGLRLVTEYPGIAVAGVTGSAVLAAGQARVDLSGQAALGGQVTLRGPVALAAPFSADLALTLGGVVLRDPQLYDTSLTGGLTITGPLAGGARIAGSLDLGPTELRVPSTGLGGAIAIPEVTHLAEPADVRATRDRAGLLRSGSGRGGGVSGGGVVYGLDVIINAPRRVFIRGRGLDAELGGSVALGGSTAAIEPVGELALIRGRLDILGKRFTLDEGLARLQGRFVPFIRLVASTTSDGITSSIVVEGDALAPAISFTSSPDLPDEEILARLLFGRALTSISPFQAAQLAGAVATLAGRGGEGIIARLRQGFGFDDLDLQSDGSGTTALKLGKYIGENVYTDVTIGSDGKSTVTLNLDLSPSVTVRGALGTDGKTGLGVFFERDY